jgi:membrane protease YdiL (CAAX protease family)
LGSLERDFGFVVRVQDFGWFWIGIGLQLVSLLPTALLVEVHGHEARQDVVRVADRAHGLEVPLIVLAVAVLAPVTEELLFRGVLLRGLLRRIDPTPAVAVSAVVFGLTHVLGDPSVGSLIALPVIVLLGLVSGVQAVRTGELSRSIFLHMGFNALTAVLLFA